MSVVAALSIRHHESFHCNIMCIYTYVVQFYYSVLKLTLNTFKHLVFIFIDCIFLYFPEQ